MQKFTKNKINFFCDELADLPKPTYCTFVYRSRLVRPDNHSTSPVAQPSAKTHGNSNLSDTDRPAVAEAVNHGFYDILLALLIAGPSDFYGIMARPALFSVFVIKCFYGREKCVLSLHTSLPLGWIIPHSNAIRWLSIHSHTASRKSFWSKASDSKSSPELD